MARMDAMVPYAIEWNWPETPLIILITLVVALVGRWLLVRAIRRASDLAIDRAKRRRQAQAPKPNPCTWPAMRRGRPPWGRCCAA